MTRVLVERGEGIKFAVDNPYIRDKIKYIDEHKISISELELQKDSKKDINTIEGCVKNIEKNKEKIPPELFKKVTDFSGYYKGILFEKLGSIGINVVMHYFKEQPSLAPASASRINIKIKHKSEYMDKLCANWYSPGHSYKYNLSKITIKHGNVGLIEFKTFNSIKEAVIERHNFLYK